jgi:hypothetical protein
MFKRTGLGITCLALAYSAYCGASYSRASVINTCGGDDKHDVCKDDKKNDCKVDFKSDKDCKDILKDLKGDKECDIGKGDKFDKKGFELVCIETWIKDHSHCNIPPKGDCNPDPSKGDGNDGGCHPVVCPTDPGCGDGGGSCASVPAPAASAMSGFGLLGVIAAGWIKSRRSAKSYN